AGGRGRPPLQRAAILLASALIATLVIIWAAYGFHRGPDRPLRNVVEDWYATQSLLPQYPDGPPDIELRRARATTRIGFAGKTLLRVKEWGVLPESYLFGLATIRRSSLVRESFLRGQFSSTGFASYFFWTFFYKTTIPALCAIALALFTARKTKSRALPFLLWPVVIYLAISVQSSLNIGHRHVLPVVPFLYVLAGSLATRWSERRTAVLIALAAVASVIVILPKPAPVWGRHLSYMNEFAGGPRRGYEKLLDSNFDWGQELPRLAAWLREHHIDEPVNLVYSSMAEPRAYGIAYRNMVFGYWAEPALPVDQTKIPGYLAIDVSRLQGLGIVPEERNTWKRFLADHGAKEVGRAGYSMLIYRIER
ncbi:MAG TPA: hypothetical protein VFN10_14170, partial [Thermoanaerobaculia bacterium]|nr:hypothetical protein [Thermoanaerobaculia bacterium]